MAKEVNPVLRLFKWEDYHDGYMITFHPQSSFERFEDLLGRVRNQWKDEFEIDMPPGERLELVQPEDVPIWRGQQSELLKIELFDGVGNQYSDVLQGALGDCWFMSALSGIAISGRLSEVISRYDDRKGIYEFKLQRWDSKTKEFSPLFVCVDRRVPIVQGHKTPAFCYSATPGELWPTLLEKAFAKAIRVWKAHPSAEKGGKGFSCMDGGLSALGVAHLLGGESGCYWVKEGTRWDKEQAVNLAQLFADLFESGVFINVNFKEVSSKVVGPKGETRGNRGLVAGHSYAVLRLEFFNVRGHILRLVQLRNPWGRTQQSHALEWAGDWSNESPLWKQWSEAAHICFNEPPRDGTFWMSIEDLAENMDAFEICDAPLIPGAVTSVRSKVFKGTASPRRSRASSASRYPPSNELGARMADDYMRRSIQRGEYERRRLEEQLSLERDQRLRLEAELEESSRRPRLNAVRRSRRASPPPPVDIIEGEDAVVVGSSPSRRTTNDRSLQRSRQRTAEALDAADGIIDGTYFGKPIITTSGSAAELLAVAESKVKRPSSPKMSPTAFGSSNRARSPTARPAARRAPRSFATHSPTTRNPPAPSNAHTITDTAPPMNPNNASPPTSPKPRNTSPPRPSAPFPSRPANGSTSPYARPVREYETWMDSLPPSASSAVAESRIYSGSVYRQGSRYSSEEYGTRTWVSNEVVAEPIVYHGPVVVDQGRRTVVGAPSVVSYGPGSVARSAALASSYVRPSIVTNVPMPVTHESIVREVLPASYVRTQPVSYMREAPIAGDYIRSGDIITTRPPTVIREVERVGRPGVTIRSMSAPMTEAF